MDTSKEEIECEAYYKHSIQMALENKFSWTTLASVFDQMTPTLSQSKDLVKILLDVIQNLQKQYQEQDHDDDQKENIQKLALKSIFDPNQVNFDAELVEKVQGEVFDEIEKVLIVEDQFENHESNFEIEEYAETQIHTFAGNDEKNVASLARNTLVIEDLKNEDHGSKIESDEASKELKLKIPKDETRNDFECKVCGKTFTKPGSLSNHVRIHRDKTHLQCKYCYKAFPQPHHLKQHERTHTGEKPFGCKFCSKTFSHHFTLKKHERIHTGQLPYRCDLCDKRFTSSSNLVDHKTTHSSEKPFECKTCGMGFKRISNLIRHKKRHE